MAFHATTLILDSLAMVQWLVRCPLDDLLFHFLDDDFAKAEDFFISLFAFTGIHRLTGVTVAAVDAGVLVLCLALAEHAGCFLEPLLVLTWFHAACAGGSLGRSDA